MSTGVNELWVACTMAMLINRVSVGHSTVVVLCLCVTQHNACTVVVLCLCVTRHNAGTGEVLCLCVTKHNAGTVVVSCLCVTQHNAGSVVVLCLCVTQHNAGTVVVLCLCVTQQNAGSYNNSSTSVCLRNSSCRTDLSIHFQPCRPSTTSMVFFELPFPYAFF